MIGAGGGTTELGALLRRRPRAIRQAAGRPARALRIRIGEVALVPADLAVLGLVLGQRGLRAKEEEKEKEEERAMAERRKGVGKAEVGRRGAVESGIKKDEMVRELEPS